MTLTANKKYSMQKTSAAARGIDWKLTFQEWYDWWQSTGHWEQRGCKKGQYVMARYNDTGPYSLDNIFCCTSEQNNKDRHKNNNYVSRTMKVIRCKPIVTPAGHFKSKKQAAEYYNVDSAAISFRLKKKPEEYYYVVS